MPNHGPGARIAIDGSAGAAPTGPAATTPAAGAARRSSRWGDLLTRAISAAILAPVAIACILLGGLAFALLVGAASVAMAHEWLSMCQAVRGPRAMLAFAALPLAVMVAAIGHPGFALGLLAIVTFTAILRPEPCPFHRLLPLGIPYIGLGAVALIWLRDAGPDGAAMVILLLLVVWASDIGAYMVGRLVGGPKLAPRISPGKTWSGAAGGLLAAILVGAGAEAAFGLGGPVWLAGLAAGVIGCVGQAGDLLESALKRRFDVKDSGRLIPGHGGVLDRVDAVLTAAPAAVLLALALGRGVMLW